MPAQEGCFSGVIQKRLKFLQISSIFWSKRKFSMQERTRIAVQALFARSMVGLRVKPRFASYNGGLGLGRKRKSVARVGVCGYPERP